MQERLPLNVSIPLAILKIVFFLYSQRRFKTWRETWLREKSLGFDVFFWSFQDRIWKPGGIKPTLPSTCQFSPLSAPPPPISPVSSACLRVRQHLCRWAGMSLGQMTHLPIACSEHPFTHFLQQWVTPRPDSIIYIVIHCIPISCAGRYPRKRPSALPGRIGFHTWKPQPNSASMWMSPSTSWSEPSGRPARARAESVKYSGQKAGAAAEASQIDLGKEGSPCQWCS